MHVLFNRERAQKLRAHGRIVFWNRAGSISHCAGALNGLFLQVHAADGDPTPDEVVVIYYENAEAADQSRAAYSAIPKEVSAFNDAHLTPFTYLVGSASR